MPTFSNAGGSLGSAIILTLLAWGVRWVRSEIVKRKTNRGEDVWEHFAVSPYHARVSASTLLGLLETRACPFLLVDVRPFSTIEYSLNDEQDTSPEHMKSGDLGQTLPGEFRGAIRLPYDLIGNVLGSIQAWEATFPHVKCPEIFTIMVILGENEEQEARAAASLNSLGYQKSLCVQGSVGALSQSAVQVPAINCHYISRDGLALLLSDASLDPSEYMKMDHEYTLIDVRRRDEIILFGSISGSHNVPVDELPSALSSNLSPGEFDQKYHFSKPDKNSIVIMCSRTYARATWAAQIAQDTGYNKVLVYAQGMNGWKLDPAVAAYPSYGLGDPPPEPLEYENEIIDRAHGMAELANLIEMTYDSITK
jgi:rhodanese-related sulfurtransferase